MATDGKILSETIVALGFFDGVHLGHTALIDKAKELAKGNKKSLVYTLDTHPSFFFGNPVAQITPLKSRIKLLEQSGCDYVYLEKTDKAFLNLSPEEFVRKILIEKLRAVHVVSGENYTFGKNKSGNADVLKKLCEKEGIGYTIVPYMTDGENVISSSLIRKKLEEGDISSANRMLGRNYFTSGRVVPCRRVGKTLGFPTANIIPEPGFKLPLAGVYATNTVVDGKSYPSITNVGNAPTFGETDIIIESHILDFDEDIYSKEISVEFLKMIRQLKKFSSGESLIEQLKKDAELRREI